MHSRVASLLLTLVLMLVLVGCAGMSLRNTFSTEVDLLAGRGEPSRVFDNDDGTRTLQYATQPRGETTWTYVIDDDGVIVEQYDALAHRNLAKIRRGMSMDEVERMLGEHRSEQRFPRLDEVVRDWNVSNRYPGYVATRFNVHFVDGEVARTSYTEISPDDGMLFGHPGVSMGFGARMGSGFWQYRSPYMHPYPYGYSGPFVRDPFWW